MGIVKDQPAAVLQQVLFEPGGLGPAESHQQSLPASRRPRRTVFGTVFRRELQIQIESYRFLVAVLLVFGLMTSSAWIHSARYGAEVRVVADAAASYATELEATTVAGLVSLSHPAVKPPWALAFLVDGEQSQVPNVYRQGLSPWTEPQLGRLHGINHRLPSSDPLDWLFVIRVVLSLAAFVLGYDVICGASQHATLKMMLSYPVARSQVFAAKLLAIWVCLAVPFILGTASSLLILRFAAGLRFESPELIKICLVTLLGLWAIALFTLMAVTVSALNREAARSLAILSLIWVTAVVVIRPASGLLALAIQPVPTGLEVDQRMAEIRERIENERGGPGGWRPPEEARADGYALERDSARTQTLRFARQQHLRRDLVGKQFEQLALARDLASLLPMLLIQDLAERLTGSGPYRDRAFIEQAWAFRNALARHVQQLDRDDPESAHLLFIRRFLSKTAVDADAVPRFQLREPSVSDGLRLARARFLWLCLMTVILAAIALLSFVRYDVG